MADDASGSNPAATQSTMPDTQQQQTQPSSTQPPTTTTTADSNPNDTTASTTQQEPADADIDASIEPEIQPEPSSQPDAMNLDGASDMQTTQVHSFDPAGPAGAATTNGLEPPSAVYEPRIPQKKDTSLREFLSNMDDYAPLIPDAVTSFYLTTAGLPPPPETPRPLARLLALATQKFIADIAADAYQYSRIRSTNTTSNNPLTGLGGAAGFGAGMGAGGGGGDDGGGAGGKGKKDVKSGPLGGPRAGYGGGGAGTGGQGRTVLTMEDLGMAVGEYGVNVKRGEFYR